MEYLAKNNPKFKSKQEGATLMVVMSFLVLMTIVTVSATKISLVDVLVSGNDQQRVIAFTLAANDLTLHTKTNALDEAYDNDGFNNAQQQYEMDDSTSTLTKYITDMQEKYFCERDGLGSSIGADAPDCKLYDFQILLNQENTGAREDHHRGGGKMVPQSGSQSSLL